MNSNPSAAGQRHRQTIRVMAVIFAPRSSSILGLIIQAKEKSHEPRRPYAVPVIVAFVCFAIVLMLWALIGTNGPAGMDAANKLLQNHQHGRPEYRMKRLFRSPWPPSNAGDSDRADQGPVNKSR